VVSEKKAERLQQTAMHMAPAWTQEELRYFARLMDRIADQMDVDSAGREQV
jgi:DNA-binding transcriptional regulator/RsmH inhibitor MraZ